MSSDVLSLGADTYRRFAAMLLEAYGASAENAAVVARHLVDSSLAGLHSHGAIRLPQYVREILDGEIAPSAVPELSHREGAVAHLEGGHCFGQVGGAAAVRMALDMAAEMRLALVTVRRCGHAGRIGAYTEEIARAGLVGIVFCSGPRSGHRVAPFGGLGGRLATNPISYAFPTSAEPVVADLSTSATTEGNIRYLRNQGLSAPPGALQDALGNATVDPNVLYAEPPGTLLPLGGDLFGHKGYALGLLVEVMATLVSGDDVADPARQGNDLAVMALRPTGDLAALADRLVAYVRSAASRDPSRPVQLPGDPERAKRLRMQAVVLDELTWSQTVDLSRQAGVPVPRPG